MGCFFFAQELCSSVSSCLLVKQCDPDTDPDTKALLYLIKYTMIFFFSIGSHASCMCHSEAGVMLAYGQVLLLEWHLRPQSCSANTEAPHLSLSLSLASSLLSLWRMACLRLCALCVSSSWLSGAALVQWDRMISSTHLF